MRKEVLFAILAGGIFGLIIAFGIWRLNTSISNNELTTEGSPAPEVNDFNLTIASPNEKQVVTSSLVVVSGITTPLSNVVISGEDEDYLAVSDKSGEFSQEVDLIGGINDIEVFAFDKEKTIAQANIRVVYSSEFKKYLETEEKVDKDEDEATDSADEIRNIVQEKVKDIQKNSSFYIGTVTDITEETLQIKQDSGEIEQAQISDDTSYVSNTKTSKAIEYEDVAIGDFIITMGFKNGNGVLDTKRLIVTTIPEKQERKAYIGSFEYVSSKELTLTSENQELTIVFGKTWKGPDLGDLEDGQLIIVAGTPSEDITARSLFETTQEEE